MSRNILILIALLLLAVRSGNCQSCLQDIPQMKIPLVFDESSFDYYAAESPYIATETEIKNCLMVEEDDFIDNKHKIIEDLDNKTYPDYFVLGFSPAYCGISIFFYYRTIQPPNSYILFDLVMVTKKDDVIIDYITISKLSKDDEYYSTVKYDDNGNVVVELQEEGKVKNSYMILSTGHVLEQAIGK